MALVPDLGTAISAKTPPPFRARIGYWVFSIVAMIGLPLLPIFVEAAKSHGVVKAETYLLTAAVLAAGFGFASEGNFFRAAYLAIFIYSIVFEYQPEADAAVHEGQPGYSPEAVLEPSGPLGLVSVFWHMAADWISLHRGLFGILSVIAVQAVERFTWHVIRVRRFPDWLKEG